jgi:hypothetical protein
MSVREKVYSVFFYKSVFQERNTFCYGQNIEEIDLCKA